MKKLGKILLFGTAIGAACAGVYYFLNKKDAENSAEDFDAFDDLEEEDHEEGDRTYVPLNLNATEDAADTTAESSEEETESKAASDTKKASNIPDELTDLDDIEDEASEEK